MRHRAADRGADLVPCHRLLTVVPNPAWVLTEMVRVAAPGGLVVVKEHDHAPATDAGSTREAHCPQQHRARHHEMPGKLKVCR
jgi:ubiquinone/menaquinone biosynthesis C-methylase UbiE